MSLVIVFAELFNDLIGCMKLIVQGKQELPNNMGLITSRPKSIHPAISYRNHQKNMVYFSHLAPLVLFVFY